MLSGVSAKTAVANRGRALDCRGSAHTRTLWGTLQAKRLELFLSHWASRSFATTLFSRPSAPVAPSNVDPEVLRNTAGRPASNPALPAQALHCAGAIMR